MKIRIFETPEETASAMAEHIARTLTARPDVVLGLPAGRTPLLAYSKLRQMQEAGRIDFSRAVTFNLDEFVGISASHPGSFRTFMNRHLFSGAGFHDERIHFLQGDAPDLDAECDRYEAAIEAAGGIDLQILGIGTNGHIGFNEPAEELVARTHRVRLADTTRRDNAALFGGDASQVPREALSMGMATILKADAILLIATGARKAQCVEPAVRGPLSTRLPASFLQIHRHVDVYLDRAAASGLA